MANKTANSYIADRGEVTLTITAADVAAITNLTTAETMTLDGAVRKFNETQPQTRQYSEVFVTAEDTPIKTMSTKVTATKWTLMIVDDYSKDGTVHELGAVAWIQAFELFEEYFKAKRQITSMTVTQAGNASPMIETTLNKVDIESITQPAVDADSTAPNEVTIVLVVESYTKAAHA